LKKYIIGVWIKNLSSREFWQVTEKKLAEIEQDKNIEIFARQCI